jgi:nucleotide-binding universal stress UspA family protein
MTSGRVPGSSNDRPPALDVHAPLREPKMEPFKSILVDVDASALAHPALERAARLALRCGAALTVVDVMTVPAYSRRYLPANIEEELISLRRHQLARLADAVTGVKAEPRLLVGRPATVLIQETVRSGHDLLVRSRARDLTAPDPRPFGAVDMELLRKCPCAVLLVGPGRTAQPPQVVGAVNASTEEPSEQALNVKIAELTMMMAELEDGVPMLLQAWAPFAERMVHSHASEDAFAAYVEDVRQRTATDLAQLARSVAGPLSVLHATHRRGEPEDVIPEFVVAHGVDLVVMGTVARGGISGLLFGNTAERLIGKLPCSVLAVKPDGFVSPVGLESAV